MAYNHETRLKHIKIIQLSNDGNTLVLIDRIKTGEILTEMNSDWVFVSGGMKVKDRQKEYEEISDMNNKVIIATYGVAAVGINIPRIFNLVMIEPGKSFVRVIQSIGRGIRKAEDKDYVNVVDITSDLKYSKRHLTKRKAFYREQNFRHTVTKVNYKKKFDLVIIDCWSMQQHEIILRKKIEVMIINYMS